MTLRKLAKKAGVAVDTVRKALRDDPTVRWYLKDRVIKAAEQMDYYPNLIAKALKAKRLNVVPLSVIDLDNPYFGSLAYQISKRLADNNLDPVLCLNVEHLVKICHTLTPCGSILGYGYSAEVARALSKRQKVVCIGTDFTSVPGAGLVSLDFTNAYGSIAKLLKRMGRKHVAIYSHSMSGQGSGRRRSSKMDAVYNALNLVGLNPVKNGSLDYFSDYLEVSAFLGAHPRGIDAVVCENDQIAAMLCGDLALHGIRVPDDVLIVGSDANHTLPGTWSIKVDTGYMAMEAVGLLLRMLGGEKRPEPIIYLPTLVNAAGRPV